MMTAKTTFSEAERNEILIQAERLATSQFFRASTRYPSFLHFIVERALEGQADTLKERTLGIEVFGREPGFDTSGDPIVRVAAAEVRKRLAQYYQEPGHENETRIELQPGSYVPQFVSPVCVVPEQSVSPAAMPLPNAAVEDSNQNPVWKRYAVVGISLLISAILVAGTVKHFRDVERATLLDAIGGQSAETTLCLGALIAPQTTATPEFDPHDPRGINSTLVPFGDTQAISRLQGILAERNRRFRIKACNTAMYEDLRRTPTVLIGAFDNDWTMRITQGLRFRLSVGAPEGRYIVDTKLATNARWTTEYGADGSVSQDYAIISVLNDNMLGHPVLVMAGVGPNGTLAASEFISGRSSAEAIRRLAPPSWNGRNFEAVLATQVVNGNSGPPRLLTAEFW